MKKKLAVVLAAALVLATVDIPVPVVRAAAYETVGETTEAAEGTLDVAEKALGEVVDAAEQTVEKTVEGTGETVVESGVETGQTVSEGNAEPVLLTGEMQTAAQAGQTYNVSALEFGNDGLEDVFTINATNKAQFEGAVLTGTTQGKQAIRIDGVEIALTIQDLTIDLSEFYVSGAITLCNGATLHLTLAGENLLKGGKSGAGICVNEETVLEITAESTGKLTAVGGNYAGGSAGIGTNATGIYLGGTTLEGAAQKLGTIRILGGEIEASGGTYTYMGGVIGSAAGIGGSERGCTGEIEIGGGTVTANGGRGAAGIGGGMNGSVAKITISSGTVIANGGYIKVSNSKYAGAAIGSGLCTITTGKIGCADITISGGTVTANGNIGYGNIYVGPGFEGGSLTVSGGSVSLADGCWIVVKTTNVNEDYIMHHYTLTFLLYDSLFESEDSVTANVTLEADGRNYTKEMTLQTGSGKAVGELQADTLLHGEVSYTLQTASDSYSGTVDLDTEQQVIWGQEKNGLVITEQSGVTYRYANGVLTFSGIGSATVEMAEGVSTTADSIQIVDGSNMTLTLCNVVIDSTDSGRPAITVGKNSGAECKLILEGENRLTANISKGAVVLVNGSSSTLEIGGRGSVQIRNGAGGQRGDWGYSAGIRVRDGVLIFEDNPTVEVNTAQLSTAILSKNISILGGKITGIAGSYGNGIGSQAEIAGYPAGKVKIEGGVVYGEGGYLHLEAGGLSNYYTQAIITGGNVNMNNLSRRNNGIQPKNASGTLLWCTTIQVGKDNNTLSRNAKICSLTIKNSDGTTYNYGITNTATDGEGKLYLWLPEGSKVTEVETVNGIYRGSCETTADYTSDYLGNTWGKAKDTFKLSGEFFTPVTSVTCDLAAECTVGEYPLTATVTPTEATNQTITWSVTNSDGTAASGAKVEDGKLRITEAGIYQLTATIPCGLEKTPGTDSDYTRSFTIRARYVTELKGLTMSGWTYGEDTTGREPAYTISPAENTAAATIEYKKAGADDSTYTAALPVDAGNYTVRVTMPQTETYTGVEATADFTIAPKSLEAADITAAASDKQYTGQAVTLAAGELTLTDRDTALTVGKDYVIDGYRNNTAGGTAEVIVRGTGNYTGTRSVSFHIVGTADSGNTSSGSTSSESGTSSDNSSSDSDSSDVKSSDTGTTTASPTPAPTAAPKTTPAVRPTTRPAAQVPVESQAEENKNTDNTENTGITAPATGQVTEDTGTADETQAENVTATEQQESLTAQTSAEGQTSGGAARILVTVAAAALVVLGGGGALLALRGKKSGK